MVRQGMVGVSSRIKRTSREDLLSIFGTANPKGKGETTCRYSGESMRSPAGTVLSPSALPGPEHYMNVEQIDTGGWPGGSLGCVGPHRRQAVHARRLLLRGLRGRQSIRRLGRSKDKNNGNRHVGLRRLPSAIAPVGNLGHYIPSNSSPSIRISRRFLRRTGGDQAAEEAASQAEGLRRER